MSQNNLEQRRNWFRFFPEGSLEFVVITRVLALLLMLMLTIVKGTQVPLILLALLAMVWLDHMLTLSWTVQLATDLASFAENLLPQTDQKPVRFGPTLLLVALPITLAFAAIAPWPAVLLPPGAPRDTANTVLKPLLGLASVVALLPAFLRARMLQLGPAHWTFAYLLPLLHWVGIHRLLDSFDTRLLNQLRPSQAAEEPGPAALAAGADVLWIMSVLPWLLMAVLASPLEPAASGGMAGRLGCVCGTLLFGLYSVVDLAAMERVHKRFLQLIRSR
ncbi:MAG: hypothetical protein ACUVXJ_05610 [Phycisphaerae bacterium]